VDVTISLVHLRARKPIDCGRVNALHPQVDIRGQGKRVTRRWALSQLDGRDMKVIRYIRALVGVDLNVHITRSRRNASDRDQARGW
jgi:hypothetical protein